MSEGPAKSPWFRFIEWTARHFVDFLTGPNLSPARIESIVRGTAKSNGWNVDRLELTLDGNVYTVIVKLAGHEPHQYRLFIHGNSGEVLAIGKEVEFAEPRDPRDIPESLGLN